MKLTKIKLKELIQEELKNVKEDIGSHDRQEQHVQRELTQRISELFQRITELEKVVGVEWRG